MLDLVCLTSQFMIIFTLSRFTRSSVLWLNWQPWNYLWFLWFWLWPFKRSFVVREYNSKQVNLKRKKPPPFQFWVACRLLLVSMCVYFSCGWVSYKVQFGVRVCLTSIQVTGGGWVGQVRGAPRRRRLRFCPADAHSPGVGEWGAEEWMVLVFRGPWHSHT